MRDGVQNIVRSHFWWLRRLFLSLLVLLILPSIWMVIAITIAVENLAWRPRWFAIKYNQQFRHPYENPIMFQMVDLKTGEVSENSIECAQRYGLLEQDLVLSILNRTYVWPTYQEFGHTFRRVIWLKL